MTEQTDLSRRWRRGRLSSSPIAARRRRPGRQLCWGLATGLLLVPLLAGAVLVLGATLVLQTLNESSFRIALPLALYGVAPVLALVAAATAASYRRGRFFLIGVTLGALLTLPPGLALASALG